MFTWKKRACAAACAVLMAGSVMLTGCSTPEVAMTVNGKEYATGEYLAYLYNSYYLAFNNNYDLMMALYSGKNPWDVEIAYGEDEDTAVKLKAADYIKQHAQDTLIYQKVLEDMLKEAGLSWREKEVKEVENTLADLPSDVMLAYGINKEHYSNMYKAVNCNEKALFFGTYDTGGSKAMSEEEIRKYFDDNYLSYKIIELSLMDDEGKDLSETEKKKVTDRLQKYLDQYNKSKDFDKVIEQFEADEKAATASSTSGASTTTTATTTTTTMTTTTTTAATTTTGTGTTATGGTGSTEEEEETDPNRKDIDANLYGDEDFTNAVKKVKIGEAQIVEYKKGGSTNTAALILRLDPEEREDGKDFFKENRENIISGAKYEEFSEEVQAKVKEYHDKGLVVVNDRAIKMCKPQNFENT